MTDKNKSIDVYDVIAWAESMYRLVGTDMQPPDRIVDIATSIVESGGHDDGVTKFLYFQCQGSGLDYFEVVENADLNRLDLWMYGRYQQEDQNLLNWMRVAKIGDHKDHRLGTIVKIN